jgi:DNA-binding CsgD family transcriptional regulator
VERNGDERWEISGNGRGRDSALPEASSELQAGQDGAHPTPEGGRLGEDPDRNLGSWVNWQSALYAFVLVIACVFLVPLTSFWWVVPILGAAVPLALAVLGRSGSAPKQLDVGKSKEQELLEVLAERGELTPTTAAMQTSLTVDEASKTLDGLAAKGHLKLRTGEGTVAYALPEQDPYSPADAPRDAPRARQVQDAAPTRRLDDPLSERELEVLALLASGRTNAEIARELFVALGTVKSHVNNIYRKLGAANRAEAVTRARELNLLR